MDSVGKTMFFLDEMAVGYYVRDTILILSARELNEKYRIVFPFNILLCTHPYDGRLLYVVATNRPKELVAWSIPRNCALSHISFETPIQSIQMSGIYLCIKSVGSTVVARSEPFAIISRTNAPTAVEAISLISDDPYHCSFAWSEQNEPEKLHISKTPTTETPVCVKAHKKPIVGISIAPNGKYVATMSETGTLLRLWSLNGEQLHTSRRGFTQASIVHMSFSPCSQFLCFASNHSSVHVIRIERASSDGTFSFLKRADIVVSLPKVEEFDAFILEGGKMLCVITNDGTLLSYLLDHTKDEYRLRTQIVVPRIAEAILANEKQEEDVNLPECSALFKI